MTAGNGKLKPGRPKLEVTDEELKIIEALAGKLRLDQISDYLGFSERTLRRRLQDEPRVLAAHKKGKARAIHEMAETLFCRGRAGDMTAAIFYLKTQAGWKETSRHELTGADGGPITTEEITDAREKLQRRMDRLARFD